MVFHIISCQKENNQYILQDGDGGHLGFMNEQGLKIKNSVRNDFFIRNSHWKVEYVVFRQKVKIDILQSRYKKIV